MDIISKYFPDITSSQKEQLSSLLPIYQKWNSRINVISRKDIDHLYERHVLHSLGIARILSFSPNTKITDIGTGGGFPGIPLAILFPESHFHLVDSIGKKIKVVEEVSEELGLTNVSYEQTRAELMDGKYDFIVSRAVTALPVFVQWVKKLIKPQGFNAINNGILYIKGGHFDEELKKTRLKSTVYNLSDFFEEEFFVTKSILHMY